MLLGRQLSSLEGVRRCVSKTYGVAVRPEEIPPARVNHGLSGRSQVGQFCGRTGTYEKVTA